MHTGDDLDDLVDELEILIREDAASFKSKAKLPAGSKVLCEEEKSEFARASENHLFPTEMSCSQAFDLLLKCYSIGGQIRHYYRYGDLSHCKDQRKRLKFCLFNKLKPEEDRKRNVAQFYKERLAEKMSDGYTSEAVWESRKEPLRRPFREDAESYVFEDSN